MKNSAANQKLSNAPGGKEQLAVRVVKKLIQEGRHQAYFAGGCVRDLVMKRAAEDYDIATSAKPEEVERLFRKCVPVGKRFGVILVIENGIQFEVATFREEADYADGRRPDRVSFTNAETDAKRRDFTVNGLFYDPLGAQIIDYVGGIEDIQKRVIRTIGRPEARFQEDRLRLLRAIRFAANLGFEIAPDTWNAVRRQAKEIKKVSQERIRDELIKMFTRSGGGRGLKLLSESGLLAEILPEIEAMKGIEQQPDWHPEGDVFVHTCLLMDQTSGGSPVLAFGALLHDVGKPPTFSMNEGKIHFYNHAHEGARIAKGILKRLRFSNQETANIESCVENHMKFGDVRKMRVGKLKQFVSRGNFDTELEMHRIDCLASHKDLSIYQFLQEKKREFEAEDLKPKRLLTGHDLIRLGIAPGPVMKKILAEVYTCQLEGAFKAKQDALGWVRKRYPDAVSKSKKRGVKK